MQYVSDPCSEKIIWRIVMKMTYPHQWRMHLFDALLDEPEIMNAYERFTTPAAMEKAAEEAWCSEFDLMEKLYRICSVTSTQHRCTFEQEKSLLRKVGNRDASAFAVGAYARHSYWWGEFRAGRGWSCREMFHHWSLIPWRYTTQTWMRMHTLSQTIKYSFKVKDGQSIPCL